MEFCAGTSRTALRRLRPGRAALVVALLAAGLLLSLAGTASADTRHPTQSLEFGVDGTSASKFNDEIKSIAYDQKHHRLWVLTFFQGERGKLYSFDNPSPGVFNPRPGFPVSRRSRDVLRPLAGGRRQRRPVSGRVYVITNAQGEESVHALRTGRPGGDRHLAVHQAVRRQRRSRVRLAVRGDVDANGNLWVTLREEEKAIIFNPGGLQVGEMPFDYLRPCQIEFDPNNGDMFVEPVGRGSFYRHTAASEFTERSAPSEAASTTSTTTGRPRGCTRRAAFSKAGRWPRSPPIRGIGELVEEFGKSAGDVVVAVAGSWGRSGYPHHRSRHHRGQQGTTKSPEPYRSVRRSSESRRRAFDEDRSVTAKVPGLVNKTIYHYRLVAGNANGKGNGKDHLLEPHFVDSLRTEPATDIDRTTATLNASFFGTGEDTTYHFEWGQNSVSENETRRSR